MSAERNETRLTNGIDVAAELFTTADDNRFSIGGTRFVVSGKMDDAEVVPPSERTNLIERWKLGVERWTFS
jgi:hypothetical protein